MRFSLPLALLCLALCPVPACQVQPTTVRPVAIPESPAFIAHRGDSAHSPENSLAAVRAAFELEPAPHFVEIDVHASRDGELIVIHDDELERTANARGRVSRMDWSELTRVKVGYSEKFGDAYAHEPLPRLGEVLDLAADYQGSIMIEVKARAAGIAVGQLLRDRQEIGQHLVASFQAAAIVGAQMSAPGVRTLYLVGDPGPADLRLATQLGASILGCHYDHVDAELVHAVHQAGLKLWVYTVNDRGTGQKLIQLGANGVISDRAGELRPEVERGLAEQMVESR